MDVLFLVAACRFFGASGTGPVSDPLLRLLFSTFSRLPCLFGASAPVLQAWEWSFGWVSLPLRRLKCIIPRGSGWSREINLRLPPQEPLFFIKCLSSVSLDSQLLLCKVSGLAGFGLIGSVIAGAGSPIRLLLLRSKYPRDCSVSNHTQDQSSHLQFTVNELLLGLPMANS